MGLDATTSTPTTSTSTRGRRGVKKSKFKSPTGRSGLHFQTQFTMPGTYKFICTLHRAGDADDRHGQEDRSSARPPMSPDPVDRRDFLAGAGGCSSARSPARRSSSTRAPTCEAGVRRSRCRRRWRRPSAAALRAARSRPVLRRPAPAATAREYWIEAEPVKWNIVPTHRDQMMDEKVKGKTEFTAYGYRRYTPGFAEPLGPGDDAGAADRGRGRRHGRRPLPQQAQRRR